MQLTGLCVIANATYVIERKGDVAVLIVGDGVHTVTVIPEKVTTGLTRAVRGSNEVKGGHTTVTCDETGSYAKIKLSGICGYKQARKI